MLRRGFLMLEVASSGVPSHGFPATPREVQVQYIAEVDYVGRVKDFMAAPPIEKVQEGLRPMLPAVEAAIGRLDVHRDIRLGRVGTSSCSSSVAELVQTRRSYFLPRSYLDATGDS